MKKIIYSLISSIVILCFTACDPQDNDSHSLGGQLVAESDISFNVAATGNPNEYTFTNTSKELPSDVRLFFSLGDGKTIEVASGASVTKVYEFAGSYNVSLLAFTKAGHIGVSQMVTVNQDLVHGLDYNSAANVWKAVDESKAYSIVFWWADAGWTQVGNPDFKQDGNVYTITSKTATVAEWQAQNTFNTNSLTLAGTDVFDFSCIMKASKDSRMTIKLCTQGDDDNKAFYKNDIQLKAGKSQVVAFNNSKLSKGSSGKIKLVFDFGGCQAGTEFSIASIALIKK